MTQLQLFIYRYVKRLNLVSVLYNSAIRCSFIICPIARIQKDYKRELWLYWPEYFYFWSSTAKAQFWNETSCDLGKYRRDFRIDHFIFGSNIQPPLYYLQTICQSQTSAISCIKLKRGAHHTTSDQFPEERGRVPADTPLSYVAPLIMRRHWNFDEPQIGSQIRVQCWSNSEPEIFCAKPK